MNKSHHWEELARAISDTVYIEPFKHYVDNLKILLLQSFRSKWPTKMQWKTKTRRLFVIYLFPLLIWYSSLFQKLIGPLKDQIRKSESI